MCKWGLPCQIATCRGPDQKMMRCCMHCQQTVTAAAVDPCIPPYVPLQSIPDTLGDFLFFFFFWFFVLHSSDRAATAEFGDPLQRLGSGKKKTCTTQKRVCEAPSIVCPIIKSTQLSGNYATFKIAIRPRVTKKRPALRRLCTHLGKGKGVTRLQHQGLSIPLNALTVANTGIKKTKTKTTWHLSKEEYMVAMTASVL